MSDAEYGYDFCIFYTPKGVKCSVNPEFIGVLKQMQLGYFSVQELADKLDLPESTIRTMIKRMLQTELISSKRMAGDFRTVYYTNTSSIICTTFELDSDKPQIYSDVLDNLNADCFFTPICQLAMMDLYFEKYKIAMNPYFERVASYIAESFYKNSYKNLESLFSDIESLLNEKTYLSNKINIENNKIIYRMIADESDSSPYYAVLWGYIAFILRLIIKQTGKEHVVTSVNFEDKKSIEVIIEKYDETIKPYKILNLNGAIIQNNTPDTEMFSIYYSKDKPILITNELMISILDNLVDEPLPLSDLVHATNSPNATVYSNVNKLIDLELIKHVMPENSSKPMTFGITCTKVLGTKKKSNVEKDRVVLENISKEIVSGEKGMCDGFLEIISNSTQMLGFNTDHLLQTVGGWIYQSYRNDLKDTSIDDVIKNTAKMIESQEHKVKLLKVFPVTLEYSNITLPEYRRNIIKGLQKGYLEELFRDRGYDSNFTYTWTSDDTLQVEIMLKRESENRYRFTPPHIQVLNKD